MARLQVGDKVIANTPLHPNWHGSICTVISDYSRDEVLCWSGYHTVVQDCSEQKGILADREAIPIPEKATKDQIKAIKGLLG